MFLFISALTLFVATVPNISYAATTQDQNLNQMEQELEFLFEDATTLEGDKYILNEDMAAEYFGLENLATINIFIKLLNDETVTEAEFVEAGLGTNNIKEVSNNGGISTYSWRGCVGEKIMIATGLGFITGGMNKLIDEKAWKKLSIEIAKVVGKNAIKGGVVGLTASFAVWSVVCIGE